MYMLCQLLVSWTKIRWESKSGRRQYFHQTLFLLYFYQTLSLPPSSVSPKISPPIIIVCIIIVVNMRTINAWTQGGIKSSQWSFRPQHFPSSLESWDALACNTKESIGKKSAKAGEIKDQWHFNALQWWTDDFWDILFFSWSDRWPWSCYPMQSNASFFRLCQRTLLRDVVNPTKATMKQPSYESEL